MPSRNHRVESFELSPGRVIGGKYEVESLLGAGWEGEVYKVFERRTGAPRAAKLFFPQRNERDKALNFYARKLEQLRDCELLIQYHHSEEIRWRGARVTALISEFVEGAILEDFIKAQPGKRFTVFQALHLLRELAEGVEQIHDHGEYHGDLHIGNLLIRRWGVWFDIKLVDLYDMGRSTGANRRADVVEMIRVFHDCLGGQKRYASQPPEVKEICCGLKRSVIERKFPTARALREHLDEFEWSDGAG